jgi:hypothetical protein
MKLRDLLLNLKFITVFTRVNPWTLAYPKSGLHTISFYFNIILPSWSLILRAEHILKVFENGMLEVNIWIEER